MKPDEEILWRIKNIEAKLDALSISDKMKGESNKILTPPQFKIDVKIINKEAFSRFIGIGKLDDLPDDLDLRIANFNYGWQCDVFNSCITTYQGTAFIIRKDTGATLSWNLIESASQKDHGIPYWSTSPYYNFARNATQVDFGFGTDGGRTCDVSSCVNCYSDAGAISVTWNATAC